MVSKLSLIFLVVVVVLHVTEARRIRRDVSFDESEEKKIVQVIGNAAAVIRMGVGGIKRKIEENPFVQLVSGGLRDISESVHHRGREFIKNLKPRRKGSASELE
ncbi:hypothetical protein JTB14_005875 [Gonioctena quinquepunctata]|nr:hypothetical protein JTB14_005875 [Gonioctena quinquepunctata]